MIRLRHLMDGGQFLLQYSPANSDDSSHRLVDTVDLKLSQQLNLSRDGRREFKLSFVF